MTTVLGIDGGGTKTECVAVSEDGRLGGHGWGGPLNTNFVDENTARRSLIESVDGALGTGTRAVVRVVMAGPMRPALARVVLSERLPGAVVDLVPEGALVLAAAGLDDDDEGPRMALIAGTGSIGLGRGPQSGTGISVGGWGTLIGDEGSAYDLGRQALAAVAHAADGRGPATALTRAVLAWAGVDDPGRLPSVVYRSDAPPDRARIAALGVAVDHAAAASDAVAAAIVERAAEALMLHLEALGRALHLDSGDAFPIAASGGVLRSRGMVYRELSTRVTARWPAARLFVPTATAAWGAAAMALAAEGRSGPDARRRLLAVTATEAEDRDGTTEGGSL